MIEFLFFSSFASALALIGLNSSGSDSERDSARDNDEVTQDIELKIDDVVKDCVADCRERQLPIDSNEVDFCDVNASSEVNSIENFLSGTPFFLLPALDVVPIDGGSVAYIDDKSETADIDHIDTVVVRGTPNGGCGVADAGVAGVNLVVEAGYVGYSCEDDSTSFSVQDTTVIGFRPEDQDLLVLFHDTLLFDSEENSLSVSHKGFEASIESVGSGSRINMLFRGAIVESSSEAQIEQKFVSLRSIYFPDLASDRISSFLLVTRDPSGFYLPIGEFYQH